LPSLCADWEGAGGIGAGGQGGTSSKCFDNIFASVVSIVHAGDIILLKDSECIYSKEDLESGNCHVNIAVAVHKNNFRKALFSKHRQDQC